MRDSAPSAESGGLSVICPCLNEAESLPALVARLRPVLRQLAEEQRQPVELILIDDGSTDETWTRMETLRLAWPLIRTARHPITRGIAAAWNTGVAQASGEWICVLDADLQYRPEEIPRLWQALHRAGTDIVQGTRSPDGRRRDLRFILSRGLNGVLNVAFGMSLRDNKSGFFLCRRAAFRQLLASRGAYRHWQCFVMVAAHHSGYQIHQVDTPFDDRAAGRSAFGRLALGAAAAVAVDLLRATRDYRRRDR